MHVMVPSNPLPLVFMFLSTAAEICLCLRGIMDDSLFIDKKILFHSVNHLSLFRHPSKCVRCCGERIGMQTGW